MTGELLRPRHTAVRAMSERSSIPELPRVARGASYNFAGAVARSLLGFVVVFVLAKILSAYDMGLFFLGLNILTFAAIIGIAGLDAGLRRFISIAHGNKDAAAAWAYFDTAVAMAALINIALAGALFVGANYLGNVVFDKPELSPMIRMLTPYLVLFVAAELLLSVTQGYKHMKYWVLCLDILNNVLRIALALAFSALGFALYGIVAAYVIAILIASALAYYYFSKIMPARPAGSNGYRFRTMASFSFPVSLAKLLNSGTGVIETLLLGFFVAAEQVGIYTVALKLATIGAIVLSSLNTMFSPLISQLYAQERLDELHELYKAVTRWAFSLSLPVFMLIGWYSAPMAGLFGPAYSAGASALVILCAGQIVNALTGPSGNLLLMSGHSLTNLWTNIFGLILTAGLGVMLIPEYGVVGCAAAVASAVTATNVVRVVLASLLIRMHPYDMAYWKPLAAAMLSLALLNLLGPDRNELIGIVRLLLALGAGFILYFFALFALGLNPTDRYVLAKLKQRFRRP